MKIALFFCVALLAVLLQAKDDMSPPIHRGGNRVHHGTAAMPRQFPYMALIRVTDDSGSKSRECAGSLITRLAVLTSSKYCVDGYTKYTVRLGSIYRTANDTNAWTTESTWVLMHPKYNAKNHDNDVAIIFLPRQAPLNGFIQLVELPSPDAGSFIGRRGIVSGWGETYPGSGMSSVLRWAEEVVIPNHICVKVFANYGLLVSDRQLCAGSFTSTVKPGDGGAPLVIKTRGRHIVIGIYSASSAYSYNTSMPTIFTRVTAFSDWIKLNTESEQ